jgi:hypothetical protein
MLCLMEKSHPAVSHNMISIVILPINQLTVCISISSTTYMGLTPIICLHYSSECINLMIAFKENWIDLLTYSEIGKLWCCTTSGMVNTRPCGRPHITPHKWRSAVTPIELSCGDELMECALLSWGNPAPSTILIPVRWSNIITLNDTS